jgi:hypothetical protein
MGGKREGVGGERGVNGRRVGWEEAGVEDGGHDRWVRGEAVRATKGGNDSRVATMTPPSSLPEGRHVTVVEEGVGRAALGIREGVVEGPVEFGAGGWRGGLIEGEGSRALVVPPSAATGVGGATGTEEGLHLDSGFSTHLTIWSRKSSRVPGRHRLSSPNCQPPL